MSRYVPYHAESQVMARQLCAGVRDPAERYRIITGYVTRNFQYDYIRAAKIAKLKGQYPDVDGCWKTHMGVCMDTAALTVGMLRAVGIRCYLCIGHAGAAYHAWVQAYIGGKVLLYDHDNQAKLPVKYTMEKHY